MKYRKMHCPGLDPVDRVNPVHCLFFGLLIALLAVSSAAQPYPQRPVRIVVPVGAGGGVDTLARVIGEHLSAALGQRFIVDNRPGAGTAIGAGIVARATPDGYTLMVSSSSFVTNAAIQKVAYDPVRDFHPITKLTTNPYIIVTTPSLPVSSVKDLIALARSKPGAVTYASSGTGGIFHLGSELLCVLAGVQMTHVPFKGVADGYPAVISGQVNWIFGSPISALPLIRAGRLKGIAVTSAARSPSLPDLPTVAESGLPGYSVDAWFGFFAPARTPPAIVDRLHAEAAKAMHAPQVERRMAAEATTISANRPKEFAKEVKAEFEKWRGLVAKAGLKI
jgi:tripartite-type tricarboxylate transporter receptor subunit TctC